MEDPLRVDTPPATETTPSEQPPQAESKEKEESAAVVNGLSNGKDTMIVEGSVTSRSGRKIKPKKFADDDISSPFPEHLMAALKSSQSPSPKKRKASVDSSVSLLICL